VAPTIDVGNAPTATVPGTLSLEQMLEAEISSRLPGMAPAAPASPADGDFDETQERPSADLSDAPTVSEHDSEGPPASETLVAQRSALDPFEEADTADRLPADDEMPTIGRHSGGPPAMPA